MSADIIQFRPKNAPKQSTDLVELGHKLIREVADDKTLSGEQTKPSYPSDDCA
jgi:hypothetical protein